MKAGSVTGLWGVECWRGAVLWVIFELSRTYESIIAYSIKGIIIYGYSKL